MGSLFYFDAKLAWKYAFCLLLQHKFYMDKCQNSDISSMGLRSKLMWVKLYYYTNDLLGGNL